MKLKKKIKINRKNKRMLIILFLCVVLSSVLVVNVLIPYYKNYMVEKEKEEYNEIIKNATIIVNLKENLNVEFLDKVKVSDFIDNLNGEINDDFEVATDTIGIKEVHFEYTNDEDIVIPYSFEINIKDSTPPEIWLNGYKTMTVGDTDEYLYEKITCVDNIDDNPKCEIIGNYNLNKAGSYNLKFKATDASGNTNEKDFTLYVENPSSGGGGSSGRRVGWDIEEIIRDYKTENSLIGIDVSSWQGEIDFEQVKEAGIDFAIVRVGGTQGIDADYFTDRYFERNVKGFNEVGIPVGIYFYSYANSRENAIKDAKWTIEQIKDYKIDLPVAYDWENWSFFNNFHQSIYSTNMNAKAFMDTLNESGYEGMLYGSANYLKKVWYDMPYPVWLAHYTEHTNYDGKYKMWQMCSNGKVPGISGFVDVNVLYLDK